MSNNEVDNLKLHNDEVDKWKKLEGKEKNRYSEKKVDWYTICKIFLIRKPIHSDIMLSMMKYHQPVLKSLNKLRSFKK